MKEFSILHFFAYSFIKQASDTHFPSSMQIHSIRVVEIPLRVFMIIHLEMLLFSKIAGIVSPLIEFLA